MKYEGNPATIGKSRTQKPFLCISAVLFAGLLMLFTHLAVAMFGGDVFRAIFGEQFLRTDYGWMLATMLLNLCLLIPSTVFLLCFFGKNPLSPFAGEVGTPRLPFLYVPMAIGTMFAVNMTINILFGQLLTPFDTPITADSLPHSPVGILLYFVAASVFPALFEEMLFRGIMLKNLLPAAGKWPAIIISALVFGLMHLDPAQSVSAFGFGLFAGYAYVKSGSIWFGSLIHLLNNALSCAVSYWNYIYDVEDMVTLYGTLFLNMMIFGVIALLYYVYSDRRKRAGRSKRLNRRARANAPKAIRMLFCNPLLYILFAAYCFLLWLFYIAV